MSNRKTQWWLRYYNPDHSSSVVNGVEKDESTAIQMLWHLIDKYGPLKIADSFIVDRNNKVIHISPLSKKVKRS